MPQESDESHRVETQIAFRSERMAYVPSCTSVKTVRSRKALRLPLWYFNINYIITCILNLSSPL